MWNSIKNKFEVYKNKVELCACFWGHFNKN